MNSRELYKPRDISVQCRIRALGRLTYLRTYMDGKPVTKKDKTMPSLGESQVKTTAASCFNKFISKLALKEMLGRALFKNKKRNM